MWQFLVDKVIKFHDGGMKLSKLWMFTRKYGGFLIHGTCRIWPAMTFDSFGFLAKGTWNFCSHGNAPSRVYNKLTLWVVLTRKWELFWFQWLQTNIQMGGRRGNYTSAVILLVCPLVSSSLQSEDFTSQVLTSEKVRLSSTGLVSVSSKKKS